MSNSGKINIQTLINFCHLYFCIETIKYYSMPFTLYTLYFYVLFIRQMLKILQIIE